MNNDDTKNEQRSPRYNIHEPIYSKLEKEVLDLSYSITIDDGQMNVYSPRITELFLRAATEVESMLIELYYENGGKKKNISYSSCIKFLEGKLFNSDNLIALISAPGINLSPENAIITPFKNWDKWEKADEDGIMIELGEWHCAYQNIKHNESKDKYITVQRYGTINMLFKMVAAAFLLNFIYSGSGNFILSSRLFEAVHKSEDGSYGVWSMSQGYRRKTLNKRLSKIIDNRQKNYH